MTWKDRRVLVTGGAGFIGSNLCHELVRRGAIVSVVDNFRDGGGGSVHHLDHIAIRFRLIDIVVSHDLYGVLQDANVIFNLAAQTSHMEGQNQPVSDLDVNTRAQLRLIATAREACPNAIVVHTSTRQVYGRPDYLPVDEAHPIRPPDCNAISKFSGEQYWLLEHRLRGRSVAVLRLTNIYGPRMRIKDARQNFFGLWVRQAIEGKPIEVWGGGEQLRDMAYVDDVVDALILAAETPACWGRALNVGGPSAASLRVLATYMVGAERCVVKPFPPDRAAIDIGSFVTNDAEFQRLTGWEAKVEMPEGIERTLAWFRDRMELYT